MGDQKSSKKRKNLSVFDAIEDLEVEDIHAETKRRKKSAAQAHRSKAAQSQTKIYNHLVECRILLQRAVLASPPSNTDSDDAEEEDDEEHIVERCNGILQNLLRARKQLLTGDTEEDDQEDVVNEYADLVTGPTSKLQETLQQEYETCRDEWKQVLDRRYKDLKLHAGLTAKSQFRVLDSSFWQQVDATVEYEKLRKQNKGTDNETNTGVYEIDDSKVYQQLLKDFVAQSTVNTDAKAGMSQIGRSKSTSSSKKQVDRRASKGRKIRYKEIPKLVNFTFPLSRPQTTNLDQDEWFQSLFGGAGKV